MKYLIIPIILIIILIIFVTNKRNIFRTEGFEPAINTEEAHGPILDIKFMMASDPLTESYPRPIKREYPRNLWRYKQLKGQMWETRFPGLVGQRYDYNDQRLCYKNPGPPVVKDVARLQELPLQLRNWYHAKVPKYVTKGDDFYQPSHIVGKKYKNECKPTNLPYSSNRTIAPIMTDRMNPRPSDPNVDETPFDIARRANMISGYNPSDSLPAQYADRSKTSMEKYITTPYLKDNYLEPVYGWLPYEW